MRSKSACSIPLNRSPPVWATGARAWRHNGRNHARADESNARPLIMRLSPHGVYHAPAHLASHRGPCSEALSDGSDVAVGLAAAVDRRHLALDLPLIVPLVGGNVDRAHLGVGRLQANAAGLLVDALECGGAAVAVGNLVGGDDDVAVVDLGAGQHQDVIA